MKIQKVNRRDRKLSKRKNGHRVDGRSVFIIAEAQRKRSLDIKKKRELKEKILISGEEDD